MAEQAENRSQVEHSVDLDKEREAQKNVAERLRSDHSLQAMLSWVRHTPEVFSEVYDFVSRKEELLEGSTLEGQKHREYTPVLAGVMNSERGSEVMDMAIDRSVEEQTAEIKERLRTGDCYVRELVVGSGPHAQIYNAEKAVANPGHAGLTVERDRRIGGQFALAESPVWHLNTRTRPEDALSAHLPGTEGSLNTLGRGAVQQSDLTGEAYGSQDRLADAVRINHALVSRVMNRTEVTAIRDGMEDLPGKMQVEMRDTQTGEIFFIQTDRVVLTTGLGESRTGLEQADRASQDLVARNMEEFEKTGKAKIMLLEQAVQMLGDKHNPFPLRDMGEVGVIGPGDSGAIVAEYLLGYGPKPRKSVAALDRVKSVRWVGQKSETREDFDVRQRYKMLGLEMPRKHAPDYATRIEPAEGRCFKIEEEGDKLRMHYRNKAGEQSSCVVDHIILATGYVDKTDEIMQVGSARKKEEETVFAETGLPVAQRYAGTEVYKAGPSSQMELSEQNRNGSPAMQRMDVRKTVAVWAFAEETESLARLLARKDIEEGNPEDILTELKSPDPVPMPELQPTEKASPLFVPIQEMPSRDRLPAGVNGEDVLRFTAGEYLAKYSFPESTKGFRLSVERAKNGAPQFRVDITPGSACEQEEYCQMLRDLMGDRVMQDMLQRLTEKRVSRQQRVDIDIPMKDGHVVPESIEYHIPRSH
ncbi:MAG: hypothetical protein WD603_00035 [Patescibacteria group bacterium]